MSGSSQVDFSLPVTYALVTNEESKKDFVVTINSLFTILTTTTDGATPIVSRDDYISATVVINGGGSFPNYEGRTGIRGRGNTSWATPEKATG